jgi:hypothetical protein
MIVPIVGPIVEDARYLLTADAMLNIAQAETRRSCASLSRDNKLPIYHESREVQYLYATGMTFMRGMRDDVINSIGLLDLPFYMDFTRRGMWPTKAKAKRVTTMIVSGIMTHGRKFGVEYVNQGHAMPLIVMERDVANRFFKFEFDGSFSHVLFILNPYGKHPDWFFDETNVELDRIVEETNVGLARLPGDQKRSVFPKAIDFWRLDGRNVVNQVNEHASNVRLRFGQGSLGKNNVLCTIISLFFMRSALTVDSIDDMAVFDAKTLEAFNEVGTMVRHAANATLCAKPLSLNNVDVTSYR